MRGFGRGLLFCKNTDDYVRGKLLRWYGIDRESKRASFRCEDDIKEYGYKFHMNDIAATIGIEQLKYVDSLISKHIMNQDYYDQNLAKTNGIRLIPKPSHIKSSAWIYTFHVQNRDLFIEWIGNHGVMASRVHERNDKHTAFKASMADLPGLDKFNSSQVAIPVGWWIDENDRQYIVEKINQFSLEFL